MFELTEPNSANCCYGEVEAQAGRWGRPLAGKSATAAACQHAIFSDVH